MPQSGDELWISRRRLKMRIFEWLFGFLILIALVQFISNPGKAIYEIQNVLETPSPHFVERYFTLERGGKK